MTQPAANSKQGRSIAPDGRPTVVVSANCCWNIVNFRLKLIESLASDGYRILIAAPDDGQGDYLAKRGFELLPLSLSRSGMNPIAELAVLWRYLRLIRQARPLCYLGFTIKPNIYGGLAARIAGVPSVHNVSGLGTMFLGQGWKSAVALTLYRLAFARAHTVFFQNDDDRQLFVAKGAVRPDQARSLPGSGVDLQAFVPRPANSEGPPVFLFIGRLLRDKGVREFVAAARKVRRDVPDSRFQLLGSIDAGNRSAIPEREVRAWVEEGIVEHLGETDDVRPFIEKATAVVLPSYREGMPRVLLEAAAMGRPLIATDVPGCRQIVDDGVTGLLCAPRDGESLAAAMQKMAAMSPATRDSMGVAALEKVRNAFSVEFVIRAYRDVLGEIAQGANR